MGEGRSFKKRKSINKTQVPYSLYPPKLTVHIEKECAFPGISVLQRCGCRFQQRGVAASRPCSEKPVPGCDAGDLQPSALSW